MGSRESLARAPRAVHRRTPANNASMRCARGMPAPGRYAMCHPNYQRNRYAAAQDVQPSVIALIQHQHPIGCQHPTDGHCPTRPKNRQSQGNGDRKRRVAAVVATPAGPDRECTVQPPQRVDSSHACSTNRCPWRATVDLGRPAQSQCRQSKQYQARIDRIGNPIPTFMAALHFCSHLTDQPRCTR